MLSYFCLTLAAMLWGSSFVVGKFALGAADAPVLVLVRFLIASAFWLPVFLRLPRQYSRREWLSLFILSFLLIPVIFLLQFIGLQYTSASSAAIMIGLGPLMVVLMGRLIWREALTWTSVVLSILAAAGVALVIGPPHDVGFFGCGLVLLSTAVMGISVHLSKEWISRMTVSAFVSTTTILGTAALIPCVVLTAESWAMSWSFQNMLAVLYLGLGCSLAAGWLWNKGLQTTRPIVSGFFLALEPVFAVILAVGFLGESMEGTARAGACLVLIPIIAASIIPLIRSPSPT
jgi:drug/metabolite transporter (DMT)-like permease